MLSPVAAPFGSAPTLSPRPSASPSDNALVTRIAQGDDTALAGLYERHAQAVYRQALRIVGQPTLAEDLVQETFIRAWRAARTATEPVRDPQAWLLRIARNLAVDALRRQAVRPQPVEREESTPIFELVVDHAPEPEAALTTSARRVAVRRALGALPREQRQAIELAFFEGLSHQAIAAHQGLPLGTVKTRVRLGLRKLATALGDDV